MCDVSDRVRLADTHGVGSVDLTLERNVWWCSYNTPPTVLFTITCDFQRVKFWFPVTSEHRAFAGH